MNLFGWGLIAAAALALPACSSATKVPTKETVEEAPPVASVVNTGDPKTESQLLSGFYAIENNAWRWSAQKFAVALRPPPGAAERGATLQLEISVPQKAIDKLKTVTLRASIGGEGLSPETYDRAGQFTYRREVAANLLTGRKVRVDFQLDKAMPPDGADQRDLGVVVLSAGLIDR
jgi:hypothetical protein